MVKRIDFQNMVGGARTTDDADEYVAVDEHNAVPVFTSKYVDADKIRDAVDELVLTQGIPSKVQTFFDECFANTLTETQSETIMALLKECATKRNIPVNGYWEDDPYRELNGTVTHYVKCSNCGYSIKGSLNDSDTATPYCPYCGAKMSKDNEKEK